VSPDQAPILRARLRHALFVMCTACTLWLVVQNAILLALLPAALSTGHLRGDLAPSPLGLAWGLLWALIPVSFVLGWLASRGPAAAPPREARREARRG